VKDAAKKGQKDVCVVLAKEMIRSRKAVSKLYASKAHMNSVLMGMKNQLGKAAVTLIVNHMPVLPLIVSTQIFLNKKNRFKSGFYFLPCIIYLV
jgi:hypothetical protein